MKNKKILDLNAHIKFMEFILHIVSSEDADESKTIADIKNDFKHQFNYDLPVLLDQNFGIYRLVPLLLIREVYINNTSNKITPDEYAAITIIRHAVAHGQFSMGKNGYKFWCEKGTKEYTYEKLSSFIKQIEEKYYDEEY